jgi:hypothetical protein
MSRFDAPLEQLFYLTASRAVDNRHKGKDWSTIYRNFLDGGKVSDDEKQVIIQTIKDNETWYCHLVHGDSLTVFFENISIPDLIIQAAVKMKKIRALMENETQRDEMLRPSSI